MAAVVAVGYLTAIQNQILTDVFGDGRVLGMRFAIFAQPP
jgi:hypothetical protein